MKIKLILQSEGQEYNFEVESDVEELNLTCLSINKINLESLEDCIDIKKIDLSNNNLSSKACPKTSYSPPQALSV